MGERAAPSPLTCGLTFQYQQNCSLYPMQYLQVALLRANFVFLKLLSALRVASECGRWEKGGPKGKNGGPEKAREPKLQGETQRPLPLPLPIYMCLNLSIHLRINLSLRVSKFPLPLPNPPTPSAGGGTWSGGVG